MDSINPEHTHLADMTACVHVYMYLHGNVFMIMSTNSYVLSNVSQHCAKRRLCSYAHYLTAERVRKHTHE